MNYSNLNILAAALLLRNKELADKAMEEALSLISDKPEEVEKIIKESGLGRIRDFDPAEITMSAKRGGSLAGLSAYMRATIPTLKDFLRTIVEMMEEDDYALRGKQFDISELIRAYIGYLGKKGMLPDTANGYISLGMAFEALGENYTATKDKIGPGGFDEDGKRRMARFAVLFQGGEK